MKTSSKKQSKKGTHPQIPILIRKKRRARVEKKGGEKGGGFLEAYSGRVLEAREGGGWQIPKLIEKR